MTDLDYLLKSHTFAATMSDESIATLRSCGASFISFERGARIVREGKDAEACFFITKGDVAIELYIRGNESRTIETVHGGELVGWSWLFAPYQGTSDATALGHVTAIRVDAARLRAKMDDDPAFGYEMMRVLANVIVSRIQAARIQLLDVYDSGAANPERPAIKSQDAQPVG
jgi:CRP/FNR family cyclic AMP-dependent transcriptional regulator